MNRRQMSFIMIVNALVSLAIVLLVTWVVEWRRPDLEEIGALYTPPPSVILAATPTAGAIAVATLPTVGSTSGAQGTPQPAADDEQVVYLVQAGDSLLGIASRYNVTIDAIVGANNLANPDFVFSGQRLVIPVSPAAAATIEVAAATRSAETSGPIISAVESAGALSDEAVLIVNESNTPVNLEGWRLERTDGPSYTFGDIQLFAGSSIRVYSSSGDDNTIALYWAQPASVWTSGAVARLLDRDGAEAHQRPVP